MTTARVSPPLAYNNTVIEIYSFKSLTTADDFGVRRIGAIRFEDRFALAKTVV